MVRNKPHLHSPIRGVTLHPGERRCMQCDQRISDEDHALWVTHVATDRQDRFQHLNCPSPYMTATDSLGKRWRQGQQTLDRARTAFLRLEQIEEPLASILREDLIALGKSLRDALLKDQRTVVAALVWGYTEWEKAHAQLLHHDPSKNTHSP